MGLTRRHLLAAGATATFATPVGRALAKPARLSLNENPFGPSPKVLAALRSQLPLVGRYGDDAPVQALLDRIAAMENLPREQIVLGEILGPLGVFLAARPPAGGRFVLSVPGYPLVADAAAPEGGVAIGVPLNAKFGNDLPGLSRAVIGDTRAVYLVNPHNPSGTTNDAAEFDAFIRDVARRTLVIVDEAYIEYDDIAHSAVRYTREGLNVAVFRTLDKIYGLAGLPIGYVLAPKSLADSMHKAGFGDPHELGRLAVTAASAALADQDWVADVRRRVIDGRQRLTAALDRLHLEHSDSKANFVFFRSPLPVARARTALAGHGIEVARPFPPLDAWIRISVGTESEVERTIAALNAVYRPT